MSSAGLVWSQPAAPLPGLSSHLRAAVCHPEGPATLSCYLWHRVAMRGSLLDVLQMELSHGSRGSRAESLCFCSKEMSGAAETGAWQRQVWGGEKGRRGEGTRDVGLCWVTLIDQTFFPEGNPSTSLATLCTKRTISYCEHQVTVRLGPGFILHCLQTQFLSLNLQKRFSAR